MIRTLRYSSAVRKSLRENTKHQFSQSHALRLYRSNAIYTCIPKNACSTMRLSLAFYNGCVDDTADFGWIHSNNATFRADLASLAGASYTFVILRCPYARLASGYLDKIVAGKPPSNKLHSPVYRRLPSRWKRIRKVHHAFSKKVVDAFSFSDFIQFLRTDRVRRADQHWRPQVDFLVYQNYDDWFCVEEFSTVVTTLKKKIGLDVIDARALTTHGTDALTEIHDEQFSTMPASAVRAMKARGECPSKRSLYSDEQVATVREIFSEDLAIYTSMFGTKTLMFS